MAGRRLLFVGLDALGAGLIFERLREVMPALGALRARGCHGPLRSCAPPVTVPAWTCMLSGRDPGELGLYGFRLRDRGGYALRTVRGTDVRAKRVFDHLGEQGAHVVVLFVPPSSPPPPVRGVSAACLLHTEGAWTAPASLGPLLEARFGPYVPDVVEGRQRPDEETLLRLLAATRQRFAIARELWRSERPDALFVVDTAPDRVLHAWLRHLDPSHPRHDPAAPIAERVVGYFAALDEQLEALLALAGSDCTVIVASDHGVRPRLGAVRVNEWLLRQGWLVLRIDRPAQPVALRPQDVDWSRTRAWAEGGYHA
ncbi:MAG: alkaline phosphatase family protein, partial [Myxococcota bacterium]|nr:alkaline phosphatase family protein [Myxococcota bacterium]